MSTHIGTSFDDFLENENILDTCSAVATKRVLAWQLQHEMEKSNVNRSELARRMETSRASVNRLLDSQNPSVNLQTMERAARMLGKRLEIQLA